MPSPNKQPVFTDIPIFRTGIIVYDVFSTFDATNCSGAISIFTAEDEKGTLIERITLTATSDYISKNVSSKLIYLVGYSDTTSKSSILKIIDWTATTVDDGVPPPSTEFVFTGGLLLQNNDQLLLAQMASGGELPSASGDGIAWVIEGSSYSPV